MEALALIAAFAVASARAADAPAYDPVRAKVVQEERDLKQAERLAEMAEQAKMAATNQAINAKAEADAARWRRMRRRLARMAAEARAIAQQKDAAAKEQKAVYVKNAEEYLQSEDQYRATNGEYYNATQYQAVAQRIGYNRAEQRAAPPPEDGPSAKDFAKETSAIRDTMRGGGGGGGAVGEILGRTDKMRRMGTDVLFKSLDKDYTKGISAPTAGAPPSAAGFPSRTPLSRPPGGALEGEALASDVAGLLRKPVGNEAASAARRYTAAGREALGLGDAKEALAAAEEAVRRNPNDPEAWGLKAAALNRLHRWGEAEEAAQRAVDLDPNNTKALRDLVWAQLHQKKSAEAEKNATRLILLDGENAESYLLRAFARELSGDRAGMLADLERAARLDPRYANHLARAKAGLRLFDPDAADNSALLEMLPPPPAKPPRYGLIFLWLAVAGGGTVFLTKKGPSLAAALRPRVEAWLARLMDPGRPIDAAAPAADPGATGPLAGHYRLERIAGRGGMGQVWEAFDTTLQRAVAVKEISPQLAKNPEIKALYLKEARALASLEHPNIVQIFEVIEAPAGLYLVCEWVDGKTLAHILAERKRFSMRTARSAVWPVLDALEFAHAKGFVHRDLKPANVMADQMGRIKLMDFGIARALSGKDEPAPASAAKDPGAAVARTRTLAGTPAYRPPEALRGLISPRFDVFSLGVMLYEFTTGRLPYGLEGRAPDDPDPAPPSAFEAKLPPAFDALVKKMLSADPLDRPASAAAVKKALGELG